MLSNATRKHVGAVPLSYPTSSLEKIGHRLHSSEKQGDRLIASKLVSIAEFHHETCNTAIFKNRGQLKPLTPLVDGSEPAAQRPDLIPSY